MNFRLLEADEIEARVSTVTEKGCSVLLYKDARCDMRILDETVGPENWQRSHEVVNNNLFCNVGVRIERPNGYGEWVWKQDVGTESYTEAQKGEASDAFKRACFNWGIGRELYTSPFIWFDAKNINLKEKNGKPTTSDRFEVNEIEYENRRVSWLKVTNTKTKAVFTWGRSKNLNEYNAKDLIDDKQAAELEKLIEAAGVNYDKLLEKYGIEKLNDLNMAQYVAIKNKASESIVKKATEGKA